MPKATRPRSRLLGDRVGLVPIKALASAQLLDLREPGIDPHDRKVAKPPNDLLSGGSGAELHPCDIGQYR